MRIIKPYNTNSTDGVQTPSNRIARVKPSEGSAVAHWPGRELLSDSITASVLLAAWSGDQVVCVPSPPGAGKTRLTVHVAAALSHRAGLRVGIAAQTRAQALDIATRLGAICEPARIGLLWRAGARPDSGACPLVSGGVCWPRSGGAIRVATTAKWLRTDAAEGSADILIVDEAYQCTYADLGALGAMTSQVVLVGDPGQIDPVVTGDTSRWTGSPTGPHLPAPTALLAAHPDVVTTVALQHTWRLGPQTTALVSSAFYTELPFTSRRPAEQIHHAGAALPELMHRVVTVTDGPNDPVIAAVVVDRVRHLLGTGVYSTSVGVRPLAGQDMAVVVPHVSQACAIRAMLADYPDVLVGTANALQGLERAACVAVHPLAGKREAEEFALDTGRLCVMLSRHRSHLSIVIDDQSASTLAHDPSDAARAAQNVLTQLLATATF